MPPRPPPMAEPSEPRLMFGSGLTMRSIAAVWAAGIGIAVWVLELRSDLTLLRQEFVAARDRGMEERRRIDVRTEATDREHTLSINIINQKLSELQAIMLRVERKVGGGQ